MKGLERGAKFMRTILSLAIFHSKNPSDKQDIFTDGFINANIRRGHCIVTNDHILQKMQEEENVYIPC